MVDLLAYSFVALLAAVSFAAPNPAINRIDAPAQRPHVTTIVSSETDPSSSTAPHITLKPRDPAVNRIDAVGVIPHHKTTTSSAHSSSFRTLISTTLGPHIVLNPRDHAVNIIDAVGFQAHHRTTISSSSVGVSSSSVRPQVTLDPRERAVNRVDVPGHEPQFSTLTSSATATSSTEKSRSPVQERDPAVNRIDTVSNGVADEALYSVAGGTPVTLAVSDIQQLETAATDITETAPIPIPLISINPSPANTAIPASFLTAPKPSSRAIRIEVPNTKTVLYITLHPDRPIPQLDMSQVLLHARADLHSTIKKNQKDSWLPMDDWSWFEQKWDCFLIADRNLIPGPGGRPQHLTYGILHSALGGLWQGMYVKGRYFACDFEIQDAEWGIVGGGSMDSWEKSKGDLTTS